MQQKRQNAGADNQVTEGRVHKEKIRSPGHRSGQELAGSIGGRVKPHELVPEICCCDHERQYWNDQQRGYRGPGGLASRVLAEAYQDTDRDQAGADIVPESAEHEDRQ